MLRIDVHGPSVTVAANGTVKEIMRDFVGAAGGLQESMQHNAPELGPLFRAWFLSETGCGSFVKAFEKMLDDQGGNAVLFDMAAMADAGKEDASDDE